MTETNSPSGRVVMDADLICRHCDSIVRPVQLRPYRTLTCPCCGESMYKEIKRFEQQYGI